MSVYLADPDVTLWHGDALEVLRGLPDESAHCCVTSPPYWSLRDYGVPGQLGLEATPEEYVERLVGVFQEVRRVLRRDGTCWINLGDSYASGEIGRHDGYNPTRAGNSTTRKPFGERQQRRVDTGLKPKDLVGVPWRVAFALQADGWYLRSDIVWAKSNPMPESVTDRPTKAHEMVFLLSRAPRYFYDADAIREPYRYDGRMVTTREARDGSHENHRNGKRERWPGIGKAHHEARAALSAHGHDESEPMEITNAGRNVRSVWPIATQPFPEAHFATFPEELVRRCILAGCPEWVCEECGKPRERIVETNSSWSERKANGAEQGSGWSLGGPRDGRSGTQRTVHGDGMSHDLTPRERRELGWSDCGHGAYRQGVVLDPFAGSGTTGLVARKHGRRAVLIELSEAYCEMAARRLSQLSLLAQAEAGA